MLTVIPGSVDLYAPGMAIFGGLAEPPPLMLTWAQPMYYRYRESFSECPMSAC